MSQFSEEGIVDVEKRTKEVGQILGDPTLFPVEFLSWLKRYLEQSGLQLPASSIIGGFKPGSGSVRNLAPGLILACGGVVPPGGSVVCDGQVLSRAALPLLFAEIGTRWGTPPDANTFLSPPLNSRALVGLNAGDASFDTVGKMGGEKNHILTLGESAPHGHNLQREVKTLLTYAGTPHMIAEHQSWAPSYSMLPSGGGSPEWTGGLIDSQGGGAGHNNMPPFATVLFVITTGQ